MTITNQIGLQEVQLHVVAVEDINNYYYYTCFYMYF